MTLCHDGNLADVNFNEIKLNLIKIISHDKTQNFNR